MGNSLRGMLLNAYAFGAMGVIAGTAAVVVFASAAVMFMIHPQRLACRPCRFDNGLIRT